MMVISEITQLISQNCGHAQVEYFSSVLVDTLDLAVKEHENLMSLLDDEDPEFNDIFIGDLKCEVEFCLAEVASYLFDNQIKAVSTVSLNNLNAVEVKRDEEPTMSFEILEVTVLNNDETHSSLESTDLSSELTSDVDHYSIKVTSNSTESIMNTIPTNNTGHGLPFKSGIVQEDALLIISFEMKLHNDQSCAPIDVKHNYSLFMFPPYFEIWFDKLFRDTAVACQITGWSMLHALKSEQFIDILTEHWPYYYGLEN